VIVRGFAALAAGAVLGGCGPHARHAAVDLPKPVYSWSWTKGACGGSRLLDGAGVLWSEEGCEDPGARLVRGLRASLAQRAAIVEAFARLPEPAASSCSTPAHQFQIDAGGRVRTWDLCDAAPAAALPDPFAGVPRAFTTEAAP
jgi:hypothetical protein